MFAPFIPPQLLHSSRVPPAGDRWIHEVKYDGFRLHARIEGGEVRLITRRGHEWTARFPRIAAALAELGTGDVYLDGEVVVLDADGRPDFHAVTTSRGAGRAVYHAFDLLHAGGRELVGLDLLARKEMLRELVPEERGGVVRYTDHLVGRGAEFFAAVRDMRLEGIVCKRIGSRYQPGVRSRDWLKVKAFERYTLRVASVGKGSVRVHTEAGEYLGEVPVFRLRPRPGDLVEVQALPLGSGRKLRHALIRRIVVTTSAKRE